MSRAGEHKEDYHLKKIFEHQQRLQNDHHQTVVVMYKCTKSGRMIVSGGTNVQERLEYLLENDSQLKDAILDDEDAMNRCGSSQNYISGQPQQALNRVRAQSKPSPKLPFPVTYLDEKEACSYIMQYIWDKYLASGGTKKRLEWTEEFKPDDWPDHIWLFSLITKSFRRYTQREMEALGFGKKKGEVLKDIITHLLQAEGLDANTHVDPNMDKAKLAAKKRARGERNVPLVSSSSTSSSGSSLSSNASLSQYFSNPPSLPSNNQSRFRANLQRFMMANQPASSVPSSSTLPVVTTQSSQSSNLTLLSSHTPPPLPSQPSSAAPSPTPTPAPPPPLFSASSQASTLPPPVLPSGQTLPPPPPPSSSTATLPPAPPSSNPLPFIGHSPTRPRLSPPTVYKRTRSKNSISASQFRSLLDQKTTKSKKKRRN